VQTKANEAKAWFSGHFMPTSEETNWEYSIVCGVCTGSHRQWL